MQCTGLTVLDMLSCGTRAHAQVHYSMRNGSRLKEKHPWFERVPLSLSLSLFAHFLQAGAGGTAGHLHLKRYHKKLDTKYGIRDDMDTDTDAAFRLDPRWGNSRRQTYAGEPPHKYFVSADGNKVTICCALVSVQ